jgi:Galactose oxidase, central domain
MARLGALFAAIAALAVAPVQADSFASDLKPLFVALEDMTAGRGQHTSTRLHDGRVLIAGGSVTPSADLFNPKSETFTPISPMIDTRAAARAVLLHDGRVLITGGMDTSGNVLSSSETFNPRLARFFPTRSMKLDRHFHTATLLHSGEVLVTGGLQQDGTCTASAELFNPTTGTFTLITSMTTARCGHAATLLHGGRILLTGGQTDGSPCSVLASTEIYDFRTGRFTATGNMTQPRSQHVAVLQHQGNVLLAGGYDGCAYNGTATAELFHPLGRSFTGTCSLADDV